MPINQTQGFANILEPIYQKLADPRIQRRRDSFTRHQHFTHTIPDSLFPQRSAAQALHSDRFQPDGHLGLERARWVYEVKSEAHRDLLYVNIFRSYFFAQSNNHLDYYIVIIAGPPRNPSLWTSCCFEAALDFQIIFRLHRPRSNHWAHNNGEYACRSDCGMRNSVSVSKRHGLSTWSCG